MLSLNSFKVNNKDQSFRNGLQHVLTLISQHISFYPTSNLLLSYLWVVSLLVMTFLTIPLVIGSSTDIILVMLYKPYALHAFESIVWIVNNVLLSVLNISLSFSYSANFFTLFNFFFEVANNYMSSLLGLSISFTDSMTDNNSVILDPDLVFGAVMISCNMLFGWYWPGFAYKAGYDQRPFLKSFLRHLFYLLSLQLIYVILLGVFHQLLVSYLDGGSFDKYYRVDLVLMLSALEAGLYHKAYLILIHAPMLSILFDTLVYLYCTMVVLELMIYSVAYWFGLHKIDTVYVYFDNHKHCPCQVNNEKIVKQQNIFYLWVAVSLMIFSLLIWLVINRATLSQKLQAYYEKKVKSLQVGILMLFNKVKILITTKGMEVIGGGVLGLSGLFVYNYFKSKKELHQLDIAADQKVLELTLANLKEQRAHELALKALEIESEKVKALNQVLTNIFHNPVVPRPKVEDLLILRCKFKIDETDPAQVNGLINASREVELIRRNQMQLPVQPGDVVEPVNEVIPGMAPSLPVADPVVIRPVALEPGSEIISEPGSKTSYETNGGSTRSLSVIDSHSDSSNQLNEYNNNLMFLDYYYTHLTFFDWLFPLGVQLSVWFFLLLVVYVQGFKDYYDSCRLFPDHSYWEHAGFSELRLISFFLLVLLICFLGV